MTKRFTVKTIFAFIVLYRCAYNFNFATEPTINIRPQKKEQHSLCMPKIKRIIRVLFKVKSKINQK